MATTKPKTVEESHNLPTYSIEEAAQLLTELLLMPANQTPTMIQIGGVGIGKTYISESIPKELGYTVVTRHLSQIHPLDLGCVGIDSAKREMYFAKPALVQEVEETRARTGKPVVLFLDEIDRIQPIAQSAMLQMLQGKTLNGYRLDDTYVIGAGNAWYAQYTFEMDKAFASRPLLIHVTSSHEGWLRWAVQKQIHPTIITAITMAPDLLNQHKELEAAVKVADPRAWETLSNALINGIAPHHAAAFVGEHAARTYQRYLSFTKDYSKEITAAANGLVPKLSEKLTDAETKTLTFGIYLAAAGSVKKTTALSFFENAADLCGHERAYIIGRALTHHIPDQELLAIDGMKQLHAKLFTAYKDDK